MTEPPRVGVARAARRAIAVGIDVAGPRKGCDVVALGPDLVAEPLGKVRGAAETATVLRTVAPAVVAIDAPPEWADAGTRRACEVELGRRGFSVFTTPDRARGEASAFYAWMREGFAVFAGAAAAGCRALETFPHAVAVALRGERPPTGLLRDPRAKRAWRTGALEAAGVDHRALTTIDRIDAALCAVAGRALLDGRAELLGDRPGLVLPSGATDDR